MTDPTLHPRPSLRRPFTLLDGSWDFAIDAGAVWDEPVEVDFDRSIVVPFAPETEGSGVGASGPIRRVWYRRTIDVDVESAKRHVV